MGRNVQCSSANEFGAPTVNCQPSTNNNEANRFSYSNRDPKFCTGIVSSLVERSDRGIRGHSADIPITRKCVPDGLPGDFSIVDPAGLHYRSEQSAHSLKKNDPVASIRWKQLPFNSIYGAAWRISWRNGCPGCELSEKNKIRIFCL